MGQLLSFSTTALSVEYGVTAFRLEAPIAHTLQKSYVGTDADKETSAAAASF